MRNTLLVAAVTLAFTPLLAQTSGPSWLDRPLTGWNQSLTGVPRPPSGDQAVQNFAARCKFDLRRTSVGERALAEAGWLPYLHVDRQLVQGDVEIIAGMSGADGMCRPTGFNLFVFVGGRLAGTLSPVPMSSREDGSVGAVRLAPEGTITAEFARYTEKDALCCPSSRVSVRYRVERGAAAVVVPLAIQVIR